MGRSVERDAPIRWGIVGFGWVAQDFMAPALRASGDRLVAICDPAPEARAEAARRGVRAYGDLARFAADPEIDAVYVATPNHLHREAVEILAEAGHAILCEKPMAATLAEATRMAEAVRRSGILYGTAFDQRHHPAHRALRDAIRAGEIGPPTAIRIVYACWVGTDWSAGSGRENWRIDPQKAGGGALVDLAPHGLDLVDFLLDEPIRTLTALVQARIHDYPVDDGAVLLGATRSQVLATLHVAYNCPEALPRRRLEAIGRDAMIVATDTMGQEAGGELTRIDGRTGEARPLPVPDADLSPFEAQIRAFGAALRTGDRTGFSIDRDLHTMTLIDDAYRCAARLGTRGNDTP